MKNLLVIGNKNYSSWSLRPWILMRVKEIPFTEKKVFLYQEDTPQNIKKYSPTGKVPYFENSEVKVWDSLAICEYLAEAYPEKYLWPDDLQDRTFARAISAEMHSGFPLIRNQLPMNCKKNQAVKNISNDLQVEINRINSIWQDCRLHHQSKGPFLFGDFSIADAMFAPVVLRFNSYHVNVGSMAKQYMKNMLSLESLQQWIAEGLKRKTNY